MNNRSRGKKAEELASQILQKEGYKVISKNFFSPFGEVDIIANKNRTIYFVEVKARWNYKYGTPEEAITKIKLNKIKKTIDYYFLKRGFMRKIPTHSILVLGIDLSSFPKIKYKITQVS